MVEPAVRALMAVARAKAAAPTTWLTGETRALDALTDWFASKEAIAAIELPAELVEELVEVGIDRAVVVTVGRMALAEPLSGRSRHGAPEPYEGMPAMRRVATQEPGWRAAYLLAAARRLTTAKAADNYPAALVAEHRYLAQHVAAGRGRRAAARKVDEVAVHSGPYLAWRTQGDERVDPRCRMLEGRLFMVSDPPDGVYPGAAHSRCRCFAEPWGGPPLRT